MHSPRRLLLKELLSLTLFSSYSEQELEVGTEPKTETSHKNSRDTKQVLSKGRKLERSNNPEIWESQTVSKAKICAKYLKALYSISNKRENQVQLGMAEYSDFIPSRVCVSSRHLLSYALLYLCCLNAFCYL